MTGIGNGFHTPRRGDGQKIRQAPIERTHLGAIFPLNALPLQGHRSKPFPRFVQNLTGFRHSHLPRPTPEGHMTRISGSGESAIDTTHLA